MLSFYVVATLLSHLFHNIVKITFLQNCTTLYLPGWGNDDKQNTALLKKVYYDTNTALCTSFTLSMHMLAISHWLSHIIDVAGECKHDAWVIN